MDDRQFWSQMRRGLLTITAAIDARYGRHDPFWKRVRDGHLTVVKAIEQEYRFPRHSGSTIGQAAPQYEAPPNSEPPVSPAPSSEGVRGGVF